MPTKYDASLDFFIFDANAFHNDADAKCPYDAHVFFQRCNFHDAKVPCDGANAPCRDAMNANARLGMQ